MDLYQDGQVRVLELNSPVPAVPGSPKFSLLFVDTEGKWKLVSIGAQIVLLPCLLGTLVVTRRALTHSNCGI